MTKNKASVPPIIITEPAPAKAKKKPMPGPVTVLDPDLKAPSSPAPKIPAISSFHKEWSVSSAVLFPSVTWMPYAEIWYNRTVTISGVTFTYSKNLAPGVDYIINPNSTFRVVQGVLQANDELHMQWTPTGFGT